MTTLETPPVLPVRGKTPMSLDHKIMWGVVALTVLLSAAIFLGLLP